MGHQPILLPHHPHPSEMWKKSSFLAVWGFPKKIDCCEIVAIRLIHCFCSSAFLPWLHSASSIISWLSAGNRHPIVLQTTFIYGLIWCWWTWSWVRIFLDAAQYCVCVTSMQSRLTIVGDNWSEQWSLIIWKCLENSNFEKRRKQWKNQVWIAATLQGYSCKKPKTVSPQDLDLWGVWTESCQGTRMISQSKRWGTF